MSMDAIPIWALFAATIVVLMIAIEAGYRLGHTARRRSEEEKESPVSAISAAILGLLAFMLAFTFGIVYDRYDARKELVRDEANMIRTAWLRSDFLPEPDRGEAAGLLRKYVDLRLAAAQARDPDLMKKTLIESVRIQRQLWDMAVVNARKDMNSDVAALYIESLNELINLHALRVIVGLQTRLPDGMWLVLYVLVILGMIGVGYQTAIAGSTRRSWVRPILVLSFSIVIALIASLDNPKSSFITVPQHPLVNLQTTMAPGFEARFGIQDKP